MGWHDRPWESHTGGAMNALVDSLSAVLAQTDDPREIFTRFTEHLERVYAIDRGFLAVREGDHAQFTAVASWQQGRERRNLTLQLPSQGSLLQKVAEDGQVFAETFAELYDGNMIERRLLMDDETQSFMLRPLKHEGRVVAMLAYSSNDSDAFAAFNEQLLDPVFNQLAEAIARRQDNPPSS
jgi:GAF domain-containing protein